MGLLDNFSGDGFDASSNSSSETTDNRNNFSDISGGSISNVSGLRLEGKHATANINVLDGGAIRESFMFASDLSGQALDAITNAGVQNSQTVANAIQKVSEAARSETENIFINLQKYALYGFMIWGVVMIFKRGG